MHDGTRRVATSDKHPACDVSATLTLLGDEVRENAVQGAAVRQVVERSGAVRYEQHLVASAWKEKKKYIGRREQKKNQAATAAHTQSQPSEALLPSMDSSLAGVA